MLCTRLTIKRVLNRMFTSIIITRAPKPADTFVLLLNSHLIGSRQFRLFSLKRFGFISSKSQLIIASQRMECVPWCAANETSKVFYWIKNQIVWSKENFVSKNLMHCKTLDRKSMHILKERNYCDCDIAAPKQRIAIWCASLFARTQPTPPFRPNGSGQLKPLVS